MAETSPRVVPDKTKFVTAAPLQKKLQISREQLISLCHWEALDLGDGVVVSLSPLCADLTTIGHPLTQIASAVTRIADRFDSDSRQFEEMVAKGKNLSA